MARNAIGNGKGIRARARDCRNRGLKPGVAANESSLYEQPDLYEAAFGSVADAEESAFYMSFFAARSSVLVSACGAGRVSRALAESGLNVSGFDLSSEMVERARRNDQASRYTVGNLIDPPFPGSAFDGAIVPLLGFAELSDEADARRSAFALVERLRTGGVLLLEVPVCHNHRKLQGLSETFAFEGGKYQFDYQGAEESNDLFTVMHFEISVTKGKKEARRSGMVAVYTPAGVRTLMESSGLCDVRFHAPYHRGTCCTNPPSDCLRAVVAGLKKP